MLSLYTWPNWKKGSAAEGVVRLLRDLPIPKGEFAFGKTKLFVRSPRTVIIVTHSKYVPNKLFLINIVY